jgi:hypothetical protein
MSQSPDSINQSTTLLLRVLALILSWLSAWFGFTAGMDAHGHGFVNWLSDGNWFHHYWVSVVVAEVCAVSSILILGILRARIGWRATYKHALTLFTVIMLVPAQLSLFELPGAAGVVIR